jgi:aconitate hydratase
VAFAPDPMERTVMTSLDSFKSRKILKVGAKTYAYYSLPAAEQHGLRGISR